MSVAGKSLPRSLLPRLSAFLRRVVTARIGTEEARFRLAVGSGFVVAAVAVLLVGFGLKLGVAESIFGSMEITIPGSQPARAERPVAYASPQYYAPRQRARVAEAHRPAKPRLHLARAVRDGSEGRPLSLAGKSLCVRLCDGYAFPVGDYHGDGDRAAHQATCQAECPGAQTALFVMPAGSDQIADATQISTGRNYSQMPDAFHYTTYVADSCSCHPASGNRIKSLLHDFTLRRGDTVMTQKGLRVFHGGSSFPFQRRDFVALSKSRDIRGSDRASLKEIERASLVQPSTVATVHPRTEPVAAAAPAGGTRTLEHQARAD